MQQAINTNGSNACKILAAICVDESGSWLTNGRISMSVGQVQIVTSLINEYQSLVIDKCYLFSILPTTLNILWIISFKWNRL